MFVSQFILRKEGWNHQNATRVFCLLGLLLALSAGCSLRKLAVNSLADSLSEGTTSVFATDDDPQLVGEALPFALKTMEALLQHVPEHEGLLLAAASGFVQYTHAYVLLPAKELESQDFSEARRQRQRARRLFLRGYRYGVRALEVSHPGMTETLSENPTQAVSTTDSDDVAALYWTGAALGSAISVAKSDMELVGDVPVVEALMQRALALDESWGNGAIHEFFIVFYAGRSESERLAKATAHYERALALSEGRSISPFVTFAESVCVKQQDRRQFEQLLRRALKFDVDRHPETRLANLLAQKKAEHLLGNIEDLFFLAGSTADESKGSRQE